MMKFATARHIDENCTAVSRTCCVASFFYSGDVDLRTRQSLDKPIWSLPKPRGIGSHMAPLMMKVTAIATNR